MPAQARSSAAASEMSPGTCSTPSASSSGYARREKLRTWSPRATSRPTTAEPRNPPPPVTRTVSGVCVLELIQIGLTLAADDLRLHLLGCPLGQLLAEDLG